MWRITAAPGQLSRLTEYVNENAPDNTLTFESRSGADATLILVDPNGIGIPQIPPGLIAQSPTREPVTFISRFADA